MGLGRLVLTGMRSQIADLPRGQRGEGHRRGGQRRLRVVKSVLKVVPTGVPLTKGSQPPIGLDVSEGEESVAVVWSTSLCDMERMSANLSAR